MYNFSCENLLQNFKCVLSAGIPFFMQLIIFVLYTKLFGYKQGPSTYSFSHLNLVETFSIEQILYIFHDLRLAQQRKKLHLKGPELALDENSKNCIDHLTCPC